MPTIVSVRFERLKTFGRFENIKIGAEATVDKDELPGMALDTLRTWVENKIAEIVDTPDVNRTNERLQKITLELAAKQEEYTNACSTMDAMNKKLESINQKLAKARLNISCAKDILGE